MKLRSRLAQRLDGEIAAVASMPARAAVLQAQRAILWLRHGREAEAREELNRLQARALVHPRIELAAWLHLAEGLTAYFSAFGGGARERVRRAHVMAGAAGLRALQALCDAWLAQMAFVDRDIDRLVAHAAAVLAAPPDNAAACRVASSLGMAWDLANDQAAASAWYAWGRRAASADGDDAGLAALLYNQMQMRALRIRHAALAGEPGEAPAVLLGVDSIGHFDDAVGGSARADLTPLLRAQLLTVQGDFTAAAALLEAHLPEAIAAGLARTGGSLLADLAWCWANNGEALRARALADQAAVEVQAEDAAHCDLDECAALHARLAQVYARLHEDALSARHADAAQAAWAEDAAQRRLWAGRLGSAGLGTPPR
ncbi:MULTISPECIES: hypothetical protein [unclassified Roseateles]|uniref:hypothetical protein n=1 Tax=unclassified Roseateles TaxID=2626991 RepID=UPI0006F4BED8|nr:MULTISPECIES: hypothetical protein [unclassified Roseateles]KQW51350.1 hypothetical protein ASC81_01490 [Pelomonas sp. Root405]KRA77582.1 hypothetical protein ASD88_01490 [Pelomonas sp. Root662]